MWLRTLAETHVAASLRLEAAKDNELLFTITKDQNFLLQSILLRSLNTPPDFVGILAALKLAPELVPTTPFFQMIGAAAIAGTAVSEAQKNQGILQLREMYKLVEPTKGSLTDPWILAARCLFPPETSQKLEPFVLEACGNKPDSPLCRALAQAFLDAGPSGTAKALEYSKRALELATTDDEKFNAMRILGGAEYKTGNFVEAGKWFEQSLAIRQDDMAAINNLAYIEAKFLNKVPQAIERARNAFVTNPANADLMDTLGYCLMKSGQVPEALSLMRRSTRSQPTAMAYAHLAEGQLLSGRKDEALGSLERAKALRPDAEAQEQIDTVTKSLDAAPRG
jgi:tetratricopeptide (TPR) repeat protein